jgi:hypothetical protein
LTIELGNGSWLEFYHAGIPWIKRLTSGIRSADFLQAQLIFDDRDTA